MRAVENHKLVAALKWRYSTQKFDAHKKISPEDWKTLEQAMVLAPSSYGLEPWHFTVITSQPMKEKLLHAAYGQKQVIEASHVVIFSVNKRVDAEYVEGFIRRLADSRSMAVETFDRYKKIMHSTIARQDATATETWSARQVYIALGFLLSAAAMLGIDACPMEGIQPTKMDEILGLDKKGFATLCMATLGYRSSEDPSAQHPKLRFAHHEVVTHID